MKFHRKYKMTMKTSEWINRRIYIDDHYASVIYIYTETLLDQLVNSAPPSPSKTIEDNDLDVSWPTDDRRITKVNAIQQKKETFRVDSRFERIQTQIRLDLFSLLNQSTSRLCRKF